MENRLELTPYLRLIAGLIGLDLFGLLASCGLCCCGFVHAHVTLLISLHTDTCYRYPSPASGMCVCVCVCVCADVTLQPPHITNDNFMCTLGSVFIKMEQLWCRINGNYREKTTMGKHCGYDFG